MSNKQISKSIKVGIIGYNLNIDEAFPFSSRRTLLDFDFVIWDPSTIPGEYSNQSVSTDGHKIFNPNVSTLIWDDIVRRRTEIEELLARGAIIAIMLPKPFKLITTAGLHSEVTLSSILPGSPKLLDSQGKNIDFRGDETLKGLWDMNANHFAYKAQITVSNGEDFLYVNESQRAVASRIKQKQGTILYLPAISESANKTQALLALIDSLELYKNNQDNFLKKFPPPSWCEEISLPGELDKKNKITEIKNKINSLNAALSDEISLLEKIQTDKALLYAYDDELENAVLNALLEIGFSGNKGPRGRADLILKYDEKNLVVEIKGLTGSAGEKHAAQLEKWATSFYDEFDAHPKALLVVNTFRESRPSERMKESFPDQMLQYSTKRGHCLITTIQIFNLLLHLRSNPENQRAIISSIFDREGAYELPSFVSNINF